MPCPQQGLPEPGLVPGLDIFEGQQIAPARQLLGHGLAGRGHRLLIVVQTQG